MGIAKSEGVKKMSQEKVNQYKEAKKNRKEIEKKAKQKALYVKVIGGIVAAILVVWLGYSAVNVYQESQPRESVEVDYGAITEYQQDLTSILSE